MILAGLLLGYAIAAALLGGYLLQRFRWVNRYPQLGVWSWLVSFLSVFLAVVAAGLLMVWGDATYLVTTGTLGSPAHFPSGSIQTACLLVLLVASIGSLAGIAAVALSLWRMRRESNGHLSRIRTAARFDPGLGAFIVRSDELAGYSIAGSFPSIVVTEGAIALLSESEIAAVLAHESEHLRGRHASKLATASGLRRAFRHVPLFRTGHQQLVELLEMVADDRAARSCGRRNVASAVLRMAEARSPEFAMSTSSGNVGVRVRRLMQPEPQLGPIRTAFGVLALGTVLLLPGLAAASSTAASPSLACGVGSTHTH